MGRKIQSQKTVHGCQASGLAMAGDGVVGASNKFCGDVKSNKSIKESGSDSYKAVGNVGMSKHKTAGSSSKTSGGVGVFKAKGTN